RVALRVIDAELSELVCGLERFDHFTHGICADALGELNDRLDCRLGTLIGLKVADETSIDLDACNGQALETRERVAARAEIIECDPASGATELLQELSGLLEVRHRGLLRELEHEITGGDAGALQMRRQESHEVGIPD